MLPLTNLSDMNVFVEVDEIYFFNKTFLGSESEKQFNVMSCSHYSLRFPNTDSSDVGPPREHWKIVKHTSGIVVWINYKRAQVFPDQLTVACLPARSVASIITATGKSGIYVRSE